MSATTEELLQDLQEQGADMPCADLIKLFDIAAKDNRIDKGAVVTDLCAMRVLDLENTFNKFTAEKFQHEDPLTTKKTIEPQLEPKIKQVMVAHLKHGYQL